MTTAMPSSYTSFDGHQRIATGSLQTNALAVKRALEGGSPHPVLIFDDETGRQVDIDPTGPDELVLARLGALGRVKATTAVVHDPADSPAARGRGRPKLGVIAREVTLLPRHWEWLAGQPGGASVALRKLVQEAQRASSGKDQQRKAQERTYHFIVGVAGDLAGFEEASRALFANDAARFQELISAWPRDVREYATQLLQVT